MKHCFIIMLLYCAKAMGAADFPFTSSFVAANRVSGVNAPITDAFGNRLSGERYRVLVYGGTSVERLMPVYTGDREVMKDLGLMTGAEAGYFRYLGYIQSPRFDSVGHSWLQVRAWDSTLGSSYEEVMARGLGGYGQSAAFVALGTVDFDILGAPSAMIGLKSFSIAPVVPEPSTWALLVLGTGVLLWRGRRPCSTFTR